MANPKDVRRDAPRLRPFGIADIDFRQGDARGSPVFTENSP